MLCEVSTTRVPAFQDFAVGPAIPQAQPFKHVEELDGLRGLAIVLVLILHLVSGPHGLPQRIAGGGWVGVDLFFALSGFLITRVLLAAKDAPHFFRNFYARRALRIWPLYYLVVAFAFGVTTVMPVQFRVDRSLLPFYLTFTQNLWPAIGFGPWAVSVTWSLAIEEQFYFLWPLCLRFFKSRSLVPLLIGVIVAIAFARFLALFNGKLPVEVYLSTWFRIDTLAAGAVAALLVESSRKASVERWSLAVGSVALGLAAVFCATLFGGHRLLDQKSSIGGLHSLGVSLTFSLLALGFSAIVVHASSPIQSRLRSLLRIRLLKHLGRISFGLYLMQGIVIPLAQTLLRGWLRSVTGLSPLAVTATVALVALLTSLVLAELSWRFLEAPVLRMRRFFPAH
jgi:peptidoglycan/LPS O-acetylase OafA/YrhL